MSHAFEPALKTGVPFSALLPKLGGVSDGGTPLTVQVEDRARPYLDHVVEAWTDGPPSSAVAYVLSGRDPKDQKWRRFTLSKVAPWTYELGVFPTGYNNAQDPLAPGVPPSSSRRR